MRICVKRWTRLYRESGLARHVTSTRPPAPAAVTSAKLALLSVPFPQSGKAVRRAPNGGSSRSPVEGRVNDAVQMDPLTDLLNRAQFFKRLETGIARAKLSGQLIGVMLLNVDRFKELNVRCGHLLADSVLVNTAQRLCGFAGKDDAVARVGADEFAVILEGLTHVDGATLATGRLLAVLGLPLYLDNREVAVTVTIGVAFYPTDAENADALLQNADFAISHAREYTHNTCQFYSRELRTQTREREAWCAKVAKRLKNLTPREREVTQMLVAGKPNKLIGHALGTSMRTIENHRANIMRKMGAHSLPELVRMVIEVRGDLAAIAPVAQVDDRALD
jgi:diguanylate cyclase (GGDEF)-like protein